MSAKIKNPKLIIFDIDGTIIDDNKAISTNLVSVVRRMGNESGVQFALASSRPPKSIEKIWNELGCVGCYLAFDGGIIFSDRGQILKSFSLRKDDFETLISCIEGKKLTLSIFTERDWFSTDLGYWAQREIRGTGICPELMPLGDMVQLLSDRSTDIYKVMVRGEDLDVNSAFEFIKDKPFASSNRCYSGRPTIFEIVPREADKFSGCEIICDLYTTSLDNVIYFGDGLNDLTCMSNFTNSVAVSNAHDLVLGAAKFITRSNNEDGVFEFLSENVEF